VGEFRVRRLVKELRDLGTQRLHRAYFGPERSGFRPLKILIDMLAFVNRMAGRFRFWP
jgi:hypothetical protein